ncbi:MAG: YfhO family protein [Candidatus Hydrogenedentes bacterium]|nr:YfhO family protein [Candidatus Hydrogenedentota bacterium]
MKRHAREFAIQGLLLLALLALAFPGFFLRGEVLSPADILFQSKPWSNYVPEDWQAPSNRLMPDIVAAFYPYYALTQMEFDEGNWPLWNRYELAGMPLIANAQTAIFYPPRLLHAVFDLSTAISLYILLKLWLCGITAYICARGLRMGTHAARFASVAWMLCSYNMVWAYWSLPDVSAWLPLLFLGTERVAEGRWRVGGALVAVSGMLMLFAGHPETAFTMAFGVGVYFLLRVAGLASDRQRVAKALGTMACAWVVALLVASVQVLPLVEYIRQSLTYTVRHGGISEPTILASTLSALWIPRYYGTFPESTYWGAGLLNSNIIMMFYTGLPVWAMAWFGGLPLRATEGRAHFWALVGATLACMLLAIDIDELRFFDAIPPFSSTLKIYFVGFPVFAAILFGARGVERWLTSPRSVRGLMPLVPALAIPLVFILALMSFDAPVIEMSGHVDYVNRQIVIAILLAVMMLAVVVVGNLERRAGLVAALLVAALSVDLLIANLGMNPAMRKQDVFPDTALTKYLQEFPVPTRFGIGEGGVVSGTFSPYGIEEWLGYDGLYPARIKTFQTKLATDVWIAAEPLYSNEYYLHDRGYPPLFPLDEHPEWFEYMTERDGLAVYRNLRALPRARLVGRLELLDSTEKMLEIMRSESFTPDSVALALQADLPEGIPALSEDAPQGDARISAYSSTRVVLDVQANGDSLLVLADAYYPGWKATIDGKPANIFPVYHAFRGVFLEGGPHRVEFTYHPASFRIGLVVSSLTLVAMLVFALVLLRRRIR